MFRNMYSLKLWFCWMLKPTFLHNYMVQLFHQSRNQTFLIQGTFPKRNYHFFITTRILTGQKCSWEKQNPVSKLMTFQNYLSDFLHRGFDQNLFAGGKLFNWTKADFVPFVGILIVQKLLKTINQFRHICTLKSKILNNYMLNFIHQGLRISHLLVEDSDKMNYWFFWGLLEPWYWENANIVYLFNLSRHSKLTFFNTTYITPPEKVPNINFLLYEGFLNLVTFRIA